MAKTVRARTVRPALLVCVLVGAVSAFSAARASAEPLEGVTGPVAEVVGEPVREVTETVTQPVNEVTETVPPVNEVTETVTPPAHEVTEPVTAPVHEAAEGVVAPVHEAAEKVTAPPKATATEGVAAPVKEAAGTATSPSSTAPVRAAATEALHGAAGTTTGSSSGGAGKTAGTVREATARVTRAASDASGAVTSAGGRREAAAAAYDGRQSEGVTPRKPDHPDLNGAVPGPGPGRDTFETSSIDGSVRAPLGRMSAYVWPAVALMRWTLADLLQGPGGPDLLAALYSAASGAGAGQVHVAGVSAGSGAAAQGSGGGGGSSASSFPFSKIPSAVGNFFTPHAPLPALLALLVVALGVIALFVEVGREVGLFDRYRRRWH